MRLNGKVAVVTGAAQGIGKATAIRFAAEGSAVVVADINIEKATRLVDEIKSQGRTAIAFKVDVTNKAEVQDSIKNTIENFKTIHILVNNAAMRRPGPLLELTEEDWDIVLDVGLKGVFNYIQAVANHMIEQRYGKIINISSVAGMGHARIDIGNYAATKGGVIQLTKVAARALGPYGINVNSIAPGTIVTDETYTRRSKEALERYLENAKRATVLGRTGTPEDVANLALFLASDEASFITGQVIRTDGGRTDGI